MGANSVGRRITKKALYPNLNEQMYKYVQALAMAWDIRRRSWAEPELDLLPYAVCEGETVLDIGANYGIYSYYLSRQVGPTAESMPSSLSPSRSTRCDWLAGFCVFHRT